MNENTITLDCCTVRFVTTESERSAAFEIRTQVFVEEQKVPIEEEMDAHDETAAHFLVEMSSGALSSTDSPFTVATARVIDKGQGVGKVGRVAVLSQYRKRGIGALLMRYIEEYARALGLDRLILDAQLHAIPFYTGLGYHADGDIFLDAGIEHRFMFKHLSRDRSGK